MRAVTGAVVVIALLAAAGFAVVSFAGFKARSTPADAVQELVPEGLAGLPTSGIILFRHTGDTGTYGKVATVSLDAPRGNRTLTGLSCDRVYRTGGMLSCLSVQRGMNTTYESTAYGVGGRRLAMEPLPGEPSRTRVSVSGKVATTSFITGESYAQVGFSTRTTIATPGGTDYGNLQDFSLMVGGQPLTAKDRNVWGVTFAKDGDGFYATVASGAQTWLMHGSLNDRTMTAIAENAECPSLSPDGRSIAYKKKRADSTPAHWDIAVMDLAKRSERLIPLEAGFDDQLEWLDSSTLLFGQPRAGAPGDADIYSLSLAHGSAPELFIEHAWSPSVQR